MNGTVIVTAARSGVTNSGRWRKRLIGAEDVVPAAGVQPGRVLAQLVEDLVHLERGRQRLDQHRAARGAPVEAEVVLGQRRTRRSTSAPPGATPSSAGRRTARCRARAARARCGGCRGAKSMSPPATGSPSTSRWRSARCQPRGRTSSVAVSSFRRYCLPFSSSSNSSVPRTASIRLAWPPTMFVQVGELASSKSAMKPVEPELSALITILADGGAGDLHPALAQGGRGRGDRPVALADLARLVQEVERAAGVQLGLDVVPALGQQLAAAVVELAVEQRHQLERLGGQHLVGAGHVGAVAPVDRLPLIRLRPTPTATAARPGAPPRARGRARARGPGSGARSRGWPPPPRSTPVSSRVWALRRPSSAAGSGLTML